jgi:hypothetical protein
VPRPRDSSQGRHLRSAAAGVHPAAARELVTEPPEGERWAHELA